MYLLVLLEAASRVYWRVKEGVPLLDTSRILYRFHPHLRDSGVLTADVSRDDERIDVLILGGSVMEAEYSPAVTASVREALAAATGRPVRVFNLGRRGQTSRDALTKYRILADRPFDMVLLYHSINESRYNNCPPEKFRDDYSHVWWYAAQDCLARHREVRFFSLPFTVEYTLIHILSNRRLPFYVGKSWPKPEWMAYGSQVKTDRALRANFQAILDLARRKGEPVVLMTFALYIPQGYSREKFNRKELDYDRHIAPVELWGTPENTAAAIAAHDRVIRELAAANDHAVFVDQQGLMTKDGRHFHDCCHLTELGCRQWAANLVGPVCQHLRRDGKLPATAPATLPAAAAAVSP